MLGSLGSCLQTKGTRRPGVLDIEQQNHALLLKFLDKFYNKDDIPWVTLTWTKLYLNNQTPPQHRSPTGSFWWKDVIKLFDRLESMSTCFPNKGDSVAFWSGNWTTPRLDETYPQLFSFTRKPKCSLRYFIDQDENVTFTLPLSVQASQQLSEIRNNLLQSTWDVNTEHLWTYVWGNRKFSSRKAYKILIGQSDASPLFSWLWKSSNLGNHKFFFWLLLRDRLNTRHMLRRKHMHLDDYTCALCNTSLEETSHHLFFQCPFSKECWDSIDIHWELSLPPLDMLITARRDFGISIFREILITACWVLWKTRNAAIFDNVQPQLATWKIQLKEEIGLVCTKAKEEKSLLLRLWRDNLM